VRELDHPQIEDDFREDFFHNWYDSIPLPEEEKQEAPEAEKGVFSRDYKAFF
jgi:hypothetical protein